MSGGRRAAYRAVLLLLVAGAALAHVPQLRGRLVDLVRRSDTIVIGTVETTRQFDARTHLITLRVEAVLAGGVAPAGQEPASLTFRARPRLVPGGRFVLFLRRTGSGIECLQESGTVFPAEPAADAGYRQAIAAIQRAARPGEQAQVDLLRAALIPALSAPAPALRYHAALDLASLAHHPLSDPHRRALERLIADDTTDPVIRAVLTTLPRPGA